MGSLSRTRIENSPSPSFRRMTRALFRGVIIGVMLLGILLWAVNTLFGLHLGEPSPPM